MQQKRPINYQNNQNEWYTINSRFIRSINGPRTDHITIIKSIRSKKYRYRTRNKGPDRGGDRAGGRGGDQRPLGVLGAIQEDVDRRFTQKEDITQTKNKFKNKNYYHPHGYECSNGYNSTHRTWPEKGHKKK